MVRDACPLMRVIGSILSGYKVHPDGKVVLIACEVVLLRTPNGKILSGLWVIRTVLSMFSRPGRSQGLLYKHLRDSLTD